MGKQQRGRKPVSVVIVEYHEHQPVTVTVGGKSIWMCSYTRIDGTACPDYIAGPAPRPWSWSGSHTTTREAIEAHLRKAPGAAPRPSDFDYNPRNTPAIRAAAIEAYRLAHPEIPDVLMVYYFDVRGNGEVYVTHHPVHPGRPG
jgi:hypothetical protein